MRLKRLYLSKYKNLNDFTMKFPGDSFVDVFVGKNGTGKSNMFEALIEIFRQLFEKSHQTGFDFELNYELEGKDRFIGWDQKTENYYKQDGEERKTTRKPSRKSLPENVILYYSGHNEIVTELITAYAESFKKTLKVANEGDTREFIGIGKAYKAILLTVLLLQPESCKARDFIVKKLGIDSIGNELHLTLKRPTYARKKGYDVIRFQDDTKYWKAEGITRTFLDELNRVNMVTSARIRSEGYLDRGAPTYDDSYELYLDLKDFRKKFKQVNSQTLFTNLDNLKTIDMLGDISLEITLKDGTKVNVDQFSDGQFQSIYIYTIVELFRGKNCLTLLDEPDSFLHPEWQFDFLKQVFEITDNATVKNHVLVTSHSAITLIPHKDRKVNIFRENGGKIICHQITKNKAIENLSRKMIKYKENEQIISIIHKIEMGHKPILFTEGTSDQKIIKTAWGKLYETPIPFHIIHAFNCDYLRRVLSDDRVLKEARQKTIFGLFDFDKAYNEWNYIRAGKEMLEADPYKGLVTQVSSKKNGELKNSFAVMLPVPKVEAVQKQVIEDDAKSSTFEGNSSMTIEHLFYGAPGISGYFTTVKHPGGKLLKFNSDKTTFAEDVVPGLDAEHFEVFRPMFEFIKSKI